MSEGSRREASRGEAAMRKGLHFRPSLACF